MRPEEACRTSLPTRLTASLPPGSSAPGWPTDGAVFYPLMSLRHLPPRGVPHACTLALSVICLDSPDTVPEIPHSLMGGHHSQHTQDTPQCLEGKAFHGAAGVADGGETVGQESPKVSDWADGAVKEWPRVLGWYLAGPSTA